MSVEDLLKPRYKVIADYPNSIYTVGEIIQQSGQDFFNTIFFERYPHIFSEISWYEERGEEDMPEYVKTFYDYGDKIPYQYFKIERWDMGNVRGIINKINRKVITLNGLVKPCSEQEYLNYINKTNENK